MFLSFTILSSENNQMKYRCKYATTMIPKQSQIAWLTGFFERIAGIYYPHHNY